MARILFKSYLAVTAALYGSLIVSVGCAGLGKTLESPRMHIVHLELKEMRSFETLFQVDLRVINPNDVPIGVKGIDCELSLNGRDFATGVSSVDREIPAFGTEIIPITVYSSFVDVVRGIIGLERKKSLKFQISGRVHLGGSTLFPWVLPFNTERELSLEEIHPKRQ